MIASSLGVQLTVLPADAFSRELQLRRQKTESLVLELDIQSAEDIRVVGLAVRVRATRYYSRAAQQGAKPDQVQATPRSADLIFWERQFVASGTRGADFETSSRQALETILMKFFADFTAARKN